LPTNLRRPWSYPCPLMRTPQIPHPRFSSAIHYLPRSTVATLKRSLLNRVYAHLSAEYLIHSLLSHIEGLQPRYLMARVNPPLCCGGPGVSLHTYKYELSTEGRPTSERYLKASSRALLISPLVSQTGRESNWSS
jgi:hypothetical protein